MDDSIKEGANHSPESSSLDNAAKHLSSTPQEYGTPSSWPNWLKRLVLFQVVAQVFLASWCAPAFIPAFLTMSTEFDKSISAISYLVGAYALLLGFGVCAGPFCDQTG
ncbi:hypothetical protein BDN67DRAFT_789287 [Paxillus ammoniavirescens]|nr:hypothetical protein BDN67DRAFT_789287 [Paxillus ammoniavirescens]